MKEQEITIEEVPFSWDDKFSELALEDFNSIRCGLSYCVCQSIGMALTKLKMIEDGELEKDLKNTEGYIKYSAILDILNKCDCSMGQPKISMKKIKNIMEELEYDEEYIDSVTVDFCNGFETARNIIAKLVSGNYWKREE